MATSSMKRATSRPPRLCSSTIGAAFILLAATRLQSRLAGLIVLCYLLAANLAVSYAGALVHDAFPVYVALVLVIWVYLRRRSLRQFSRPGEYRREFLLWLLVSAMPPAFLLQSSATRSIVALRESAGILLLAVPFWIV